MKSILIALIIIVGFLCCNKTIQSQPLLSSCNIAACKDGNYGKKDTLEKLMKQYAEMGVPGLTIAIYTAKEGYWGTASGFAETETHTAMTLRNLQYMQSVTKTYLAVAILKLQEEGRIRLDAPITAYLPQRYLQYIDKAGSMTVRHLLNHTSGMPDYLANHSYVQYALANPGHIFTSEEFLQYIKGTPQQFPAGTRFDYSNTNYHVLALIADSIAGSHDDLIKRTVFAPVGLQHTFYRDINGKTDLVKSYLDFSGNGTLQNVTTLQHSSIISAKGDDGMVATPFDAINFLRALTEGKLLSAASLNQMIKWVNDDDGKPVYGMGLYHVNYSGQTGYGHGGAGAGAGCGLYYFPAKKAYVFLATNIGTLVDGPIVRKVEELKARVIDIVLR